MASVTTHQPPAGTEPGARADAAERLRQKLERRQVNRILHGFPSPRLWTQEPFDVDAALARRAPGAPMTLYVGLPYCIRTNPGRCGYCLFPVEVFRGADTIDAYLDLLEAEGALYREAFAGEAPQSIYVGGGTPNLMRPAQYLRFMDIVRDLFPAISSETTITMEGIPQLFTAEKLAAMRDGGVNRISIGVQQLNYDLNRLSGRKQTEKHVIDSIRWAQDLGLQINADLIFGWPQQTLKTMRSDMQRLIDTGIDHITHYELNVGGATDFALNRRGELPSRAETLEMYRVARDMLGAAGFQQLTSYDFQRRDDRYNYEECRRDFAPTAALGWGFAAVSDYVGADGQSWSMINHRTVAAYGEAVQSGARPMERAFLRSPEERRMHELFRHLQGLRIDRGAYRAAFGLDVVAEHAALWDAFAEAGWCDIGDDAITLVGDGGYYVPTMQALLSEGLVATIRDRRDTVHLAV
ncbi:MAG: coproporphyrinogen-III oxidase family protein [Rhodobacter sp.]|nr:coproporphyrinogen-III oxidase family protein [Rhodobacter sp.]